MKVEENRKNRKSVGMTKRVLLWFCYFICVLVCKNINKHHLLSPKFISKLLSLISNHFIISILLYKFHLFITRYPLQNTISRHRLTEVFRRMRLACDWHLNGFIHGEINNFSHKFTPCEHKLSSPIIFWIVNFDSVGENLFDISIPHIDNCIIERKYFLQKLLIILIFNLAIFINSFCLNNNKGTFSDPLKSSSISA